jgi:hypothetical protein
VLGSEVSFRSGSDSTQLSAASLRLLRAVLAELMVLDAGPLVQLLGIRMFGLVADALNRMQGRQEDEPAGDEEALSLLLTMVLPALLHAAAAAADPTAGAATTCTDASAVVQAACSLIRWSLPKGEAGSAQLGGACLRLPQHSD